MNVHQSEQFRQHNEHKAVKARLWGVPTPKIEISKPVAVPAKAAVPQIPVIRPLWQIVDLYFDWHVRVWVEAIDQNISQLAHENVSLRAALRLSIEDRELAYITRRPTKHIIAEVLENFPGITWEDLKGQRRTRDVVYPRQLCMFEIHRQRKDLSFPAIGRLFGGRDHTTALHSVRKIQAMTSEDKEAQIWMQKKVVARRKAYKQSEYAHERLAEIQAKHCE